MRDLDAKLARILKDPGTPYWARDVIHAASQRDPVDAANVLGHLSDIFSERAAQIAKNVQAARAARGEA